MVHPPPTPEDLARWLLTQEAGSLPTPAVLVAAADQLYGQLRVRLGDVFGPTGFDALWARAMFLAHGAPPPNARAAGVAHASLPPGVPAIVLERDPLAAHEELVRSFASFIALLFSFVGPHLGVILLRQVWPSLLVGAPGKQNGEITR